ncbi:MAG: DUF2149 domain-containing protein [Oscillospiraceae bacterium]|jgi:hypothetical protein|nr:DUF2149 domain-containing protein [Oscillospiraceae bacterium]
MKSRFGAEPFSGGDDINPMDGLANLADIMLVLACGLMLALVINWNVKISAENAPDNSEETEYEEIEPANEGESGGVNSAGYTEVGVVYRDPDTGKLYLVTNDLPADVDELPPED